jgi:hypothetical protein
MGEMRNINKKECEGKRLGKFRHKLENNMRTELTEIGLKKLDCIHLAQDTD